MRICCLRLQVQTLQLYSQQFSVVNFNIKLNLRTIKLIDKNAIYLF